LSRKTRIKGCGKMNELECWMMWNENIFYKEVLE